MSTQGGDTRKTVTELHAALSEVLGEGNVELRADYEGDLYLSIPTGHNEAVEVEGQEMPTSVYFVLTRRAWDRTGGLSFEEEIGEAKYQHLVIGLVKTEMDYQSKRAEQQAADEAYFG